MDSNNSGVPNSVAQVFQWTWEASVVLYVKIQNPELAQKLTNFLKLHGFIKSTSPEKQAPGLMATIAIAEGEGLKFVGNRDYLGAQGLKEQINVPKPHLLTYRYPGSGAFIVHRDVHQYDILLHPQLMDRPEVERQVLLNVLMGRFLGHILPRYGIVGFWGMPLKAGGEGIVILPRQLSQGEAVYFDVNRSRLLTQDGITKVQGEALFLRPQEILSVEVPYAHMSPEELYGFLSIHCTYLEVDRGAGREFHLINQLILKAVQKSKGQRFPLSHFSPRANLTL